MSDWPINVMPAPPAVTRSTVERVSVAGGLSYASALRALADWLEKNHRTPIGAVEFTYTTLAMYAATYVAPPKRETVA